MRFKDRPVFSASDREVLAGGELFLKVRSPQQARSIAERLNAIAQAPAEGRAAAIAALLARHTDADAAAERLAHFRAAATPLAMFGGVLLVGTFLIAPALLWTMYDHPAAWRILFAFLSLYLLGWGLAIAAFRKLHRAVAPEQSSERLKQTLMMLVSPAGTMRGLTAISVALLADFHPLAAGLRATRRRPVSHAGPSCPARHGRAAAPDLSDARGRGHPGDRFAPLRIASGARGPGAEVRHRRR